MNSKPLVSIAKCEDYSSESLHHSLTRLLAPLGGMGNFIKPGQRVLLKPNLILPRPAESAIVTHPALVEVVARLAKEAGGKIYLGDSPAVGSAYAVAKRANYLPFIQPLGIELVEFKKGTTVRLNKKSVRSIQLAKEAFDFDVIINLPKVKVHCQLFMTLAVKNLFGFVRGRRKAFLHFLLSGDRMRFARMLVQIAYLIKPSLTIVDGVVGLEQGGPSSGKPRNLGFLAAGIDLSAIDRVIMELLCQEPDRLFTLVAAQQLGLGETNLENIEIAGDELGTLRIDDLQLAPLYSIGFSFPRIVRGLWRQFKALYFTEK